MRRNLREVLQPGRAFRQVRPSGKPGERGSRRDGVNERSPASARKELAEYLVVPKVRLEMTGLRPYAEVDFVHPFQ